MEAVMIRIGRPLLDCDYLIPMELLYSVRRYHSTLLLFVLVALRFSPVWVRVITIFEDITSNYEIL
jgi:hypothetical protein